MRALSVQRYIKINTIGPVLRQIKFFGMKINGRNARNMVKNSNY